MTVLVATTIIEITRLYLGYLGNLTEKVPELAGFWLLTVLLQLPMQGNVIQVVKFKGYSRFLHFPSNSIIRRKLVKQTF